MDDQAGTRTGAPTKGRATKKAGAKTSKRAPARKKAATRPRATAKPAEPAPKAAEDRAAPRAEVKSEARGESAPAGGFPRPDATAFARNMMRVSQQSQKLLGDFLRRQREQGSGAGPMDPLNLTGTFFELLGRFAADPRRIVEAQFQLWQDYLSLVSATARRLMGQEVEPVIAPHPGDKRFKHPDWEDNQVFDFIKQSYLLSARWLQDTMADVEGLDPRTRKKVDFYTKQFADALAPTNFVLTNPEVLRSTLASNGENLVNGLDNLLKDLEAGRGQLRISQTADAFTVGENIATSKGKVVFRNDLMELIQYDPATKTVMEAPLLIFPPWINKFYILDLQPKNSFVKWATEQGHTVFVASWVNPDPKLAEKTFEDYMFEGIIAGLDAVEAATGAKKINTIGYCIGGTLLGAALAYLAQSGDTRVNSATFFAAQVDFSEPGDLEVFIDDEQLEALETMMKQSGGVLEGSRMATTFNMLRSNDLIWSFVVNNYLLGKAPIPFDLLYWNSDTTRMPYRMHLFYLRECYRDNRLARGEMVLGGKRLDLADVKVPVYLQSAREDHIAPFRSVYKATQLYSGPKRFIVAGSGHIAGVINPPAAQKYQHWTNDTLPPAIETWWEGAAEHTGSWWPDWQAWIAKISGRQVPARVPGDGRLDVICDAPGEYVRVKAH